MDDRTAPSGDAAKDGEGSLSAAGVPIAWLLSRCALPQTHKGGSTRPRPQRSTPDLRLHRDPRTPSVKRASHSAKGVPQGGGRAGAPCVEDAAARNLAEIVTSVTSPGGGSVRQITNATGGGGREPWGDAAQGGKHERVQVFP